jgi:hypothetical protein
MIGPLLPAGAADHTNPHFVLPGTPIRRAYRTISGRNSDVLERTLVARRVPSGAV